jgi:hypothetical protein
MPWIRGPCRCGLGPHAWLWLPDLSGAYPPTPAYPVPPVAMDEKELLESQLKFVEQQLEQIRKRLEELKR